MLTIHSLAEADTPRSWVSRGNAVYSTVMSITISSNALETMASTSQRPGAATAAWVAVRCMVLLLIYLAEPGAPAADATGQAARAGFRVRIIDLPFD